jgi:hypothetical protein
MVADSYATTGSVVSLLWLTGSQHLAVGLQVGSQAPR